MAFRVGCWSRRTAVIPRQEAAVAFGIDVEDGGGWRGSGRFIRHATNFTSPKKSPESISFQRPKTPLRSSTLSPSSNAREEVHHLKAYPQNQPGLPFIHNMPQRSTDATSRLE